MPLDPEIAQQARELVERDVTRGFDGVFTAAENAPFSVELNGSPLDSDDVVATSDRVVAVPWAYRCTHTGDFLGVPATYLPLELRGVSFVDVRSGDVDDWGYHRYIDFIGALHQVGVSTSNRPALSDDEYATWNENRPPPG